MEKTGPIDAHETLPGMCLAALARHAKPDALSQKRGGEWQRISGTEFARRVRAVALGLRSLGVRPGDRVALLFLVLAALATANGRVEESHAGRKRRRRRRAPEQPALAVNRES